MVSLFYAFERYIMAFLILTNIHAMKDPPMMSASGTAVMGAVTRFSRNFTVTTGTVMMPPPIRQARRRVRASNRHDMGITAQKLDNDIVIFLQIS